VSNSEMSNFFVEQGRTRVFGETYSTYVAAGKPRRTPLGGKRAIYGWTLSNKRAHFKNRQAYRKNDEADNNSHNQYHNRF